MEALHTKIITTLDSLTPERRNKAQLMYGIACDIEAATGIASNAMNSLSCKLWLVLTALGTCGKCNMAMDDVPIVDGCIVITKDYALHLGNAHTKIAYALANIIEGVPNASDELKQETLGLIDEIQSRGEGVVLMVPFDGNHEMFMDMIGNNVAKYVEVFVKEYKELST